MTERHDLVDSQSLIPHVVERPNKQTNSILLGCSDDVMYIHYTADKCVSKAHAVLQ